MAKDVTVLPKLPPGEQIEATYDEEADCVYLTFGKPRPGEGLDDATLGVTVMVNRHDRTVVGITLWNIKQVVTEYLDTTQGQDGG